MAAKTKQKKERAIYVFSLLWLDGTSSSSSGFGRFTSVKYLPSETEIEDTYLITKNKKVFQEFQTNYKDENIFNTFPRDLAKNFIKFIIFRVSTKPKTKS